MMQAELFDRKAGEARRDEGIALASGKRAQDLAMARSVAVDIARHSSLRTCTADQVQKVLLQHGVNLGNAAGGIFKGKLWRWTGAVTTSARASNHARILRVWELVE